MGIFKAPSIPAPVAAPQVAQAKPVSAREQIGEGLRRFDAIRALGQRSTNRTGPLGIQAPQEFQRKTLLGE
jgi:hypothetical protein